MSTWLLLVALRLLAVPYHERIHRHTFTLRSLQFLQPYLDLACTFLFRMGRPSESFSETKVHSGLWTVKHPNWGLCIAISFACGRLMMHLHDRFVKGKKATWRASKTYGRWYRGPFSNKVVRIPNRENMRRRNHAAAEILPSYPITCVGPRQGAYA